MQFALQVLLLLNVAFVASSEYSKVLGWCTGPDGHPAYYGKMNTDEGDCLSQCSGNADCLAYAHQTSYPSSWSCIVYGPRLTFGATPPGWTFSNGHGTTVEAGSSCQGCDKISCFIKTRQATSGPQITSPSPTAGGTPKCSSEKSGSGKCKITLANTAMQWVLKKEQNICEGCSEVAEEVTVTIGRTTESSTEGSATVATTATKGFLSMSVEASISHTIAEALNEQKETKKTFSVKAGQHIKFWQLYLTWEEDGKQQRLGLDRFAQTLGSAPAPHVPPTKTDCKHDYFYECHSQTSTATSSRQRSFCARGLYNVLLAMCAAHVYAL